ncbi:hypothetical protein [Cupriavidus necator]|uniref:hypothetical protein n=1 Tax=Cupriavidus necator TaxID=106590 RepID=UPI001F2B7821|nr:hypothetical protein [Cupriavidus necator]
MLSAFSDQVSKTGKARNRLHALEKAHRKAGRIAKAERIRKCNLGRVKLQARRDRTKQRLRTIAYQSAHTIVDKAAMVGSEDLTSPSREASVAALQPPHERMGQGCTGSSAR